MKSSEDVVRIAKGIYELGEELYRKKQNLPPGHKDLKSKKTCISLTIAEALTQARLDQRKVDAETARRTYIHKKSTENDVGPTGSVNETRHAGYEEIAEAIENTEIGGPNE